MTSKPKLLLWSVFAVVASAGSVFAQVGTDNRPIPEPASMVSAAVLAVIVGTTYLQRRKK